MVRETMNVLEWKGEGCHVCRPAINYYIGMYWPLDAEDDRYSRVVNEKMHANIQKDGTYSVIPRIYGGEAKADDLIRLGEVAKKYDVKTIKITGGQRIGLYGIKKEDLVSVWRDLDMPSGFAYGKALRTVKTCVGSEWCRFRHAETPQAMGIRLEENIRIAAGIRPRRSLRHPVAHETVPRRPSRIWALLASKAAGKSTWAAMAV